MIHLIYTKEDVEKKAEEGPGLTPEQLKVAEGGYPDTSVLDYDKLEAKINNLEESKSWDLTEEQQEVVEEGYEEIKARNNQQEQEELAPDELIAEQLDKAPGYSKEYIDLHSNPQKN